MITHSDTLLREAVEEPAYTVYHMEPSHATDPGSNQVHPISASAQVERALIDLVGDLATYSPRSKVVVLEGGGGTDFDVRLVSELFPSFSERVNLISGGSKRRVQTLQEVLDKAADGGKLDARFYSIVDRDYDGPELIGAARQYTWNVYHIENYLLDPQFIWEVLNGIKLGGADLSVKEVDKELRNCAEETTKSLIRIQLERLLNQRLVKSIDTGFDPNLDVATGLRQAAERSMEKMNNVLDEELKLENLQDEASRIESELASSLNNSDWKCVFRGRDILKQFVSRHADGIKYESFRNLIVNRMREVGHKPNGMKKVIDEIIDS
jgi:hypothetical protein